MARIFSKKLSCFYCGQRSAQTQGDPVRKWRCKHCEAVNYLDEQGNITDPPAAETNPDMDGSGASSNPFEPVDFTDTGLFCSTCVRNQHLLMSALASWLPSSEDPSYGAYEREYPKFRRNLEEQYPQVCAKCEPRVQERIREAGYEAKADYIRRMMEWSKAGREARRARNRNWRSLLVFAGAIGYWGSVAGQLAWNLMSALAAEQSVQDTDNPLSPPSLLSCVGQTVATRHLPGRCSVDLAPYAGLSLVAGILFLWWNPKLRMKVEGRNGRFAGLGEYYQVQLIVMVVRCAFWAVLRDPSSSGLPPTMPPGLHWFMVLFTILSVVISRRIVQYDTRPLVSWSELPSATTPTHMQPSGSEKSYMRPSESTPRHTQRFPIEKLATPRPVRETEPAVPPTPPPVEVDDMDWTPSLQQDIRPTVSVYERNQKSVLDGPLPFYGSLPPAPKPPSWNILNPPAQKPIQKAIEPNPFHQTPTQSAGSWQRNTDEPEPVFAPPKFFPQSDYTASTGLEAMFDRAFTIRSPEDEAEEDWQRMQNASSYHSVDMQNRLQFQALRLGLLLASILAWVLSQNDYIAIPGNYIEVASLGSASLISGFALLESLKRPMAQWNGMEILVYLAELVAAVHLGGNLPRVSFDRVYFDRYGKLLLIFMAVQEALSLLTVYRSMPAAGANPEVQPTHHESPNSNNTSGNPTIEKPASQSWTQASNSQSSVPPLSFSSTVTGSSFSSQPSEMKNHLGLSSYNQTPSGGGSSFTLNSLNDNDSDVSDPFGCDSDTETTVTTATTATNNTIRNIRYGRNINTENMFSPGRSGLGPGISGLSLEDQPFRRVTRSQTKQQQQLRDPLRRYPLRGMK